MKIFSRIFLGLTLLALTSCSSVQSGEQKYPKDPKDIIRDRNGKLTGEGGLFHFGGSDSKTSSGPNIGVNSYLWRAALDTVSFMPLTSADPFGGTIITDWYEDPSNKGERYKINILILGSSLRVDGVKVSVFKQTIVNGVWRDATVSEKLPRSFEDKILTTARQLRIGQSAQ